MRHGFVLVAALWFLVTLGALAADVHVAARTRRLSAANAAESATALAVAEGGIEQARAQLDRLLRSPATSGHAAPRAIADPWRVATVVAGGEGTIGALRYRVEVREPAAQLNVNRADEGQLRALFAALGIDDARADRAAQGILDWRDADDLRRARGAERDEYLRNGSALLPANGDFTSVATLRAVIGVTDAIYERASPSLTTVGAARIDINTADRPVLLTLPGVTPAAADAILRLRQQGRFIDDLYGFAAALPEAARASWVRATPELYRTTTSAVNELLVTADAWLPGTPTHARLEALIVRDAGARVAWRRRR